MLKNAIKLRRINHAYLFSGSRGTGKTSMARIMAKAINCAELDKKKGAFEPCNRCFLCKEIERGQSLDLVEIDAASNRGIDEIRILREAVRLHPLKAKSKVYIIDEAHMLTKEAFNALLKTLEEPPSHVVFILATTEFEKLPDTIVSRLQHFKFRKPSEYMIKKSLENIAKKEEILIDEEALGILSFFADGSFRDAHGMADQVLSLNEKKITGEDVRNFFGIPSNVLVKDFLSSIFEKNADNAFKLVSRMFEQGLDMRMFLKLVLRNLRFMLILSVAPNMEKDIMRIVGKEQFDVLKQEKEKSTPDQYEFMLKNFLDAYESTMHSYFPQLPLELAVVKIISKQL
jgi:DNA polymerase-3 subunit gamma/tau